MANGKIKADTLEHSTAGSLDTSYVVNGSAKAYVGFTCVSSTAIHGSFNISSLSDDGTGHTHVNYTNNMSNDDYSVGSACGNTSAGVYNRGTCCNAYATGSYEQFTFASNSDGAVDLSQVSSNTFGDLA
tara:strand:- start:60 stop:446 length:387 start_codon:yes stop_codon:yes gene_type:complete